ncbi:MAG: hypothetical protein OEZ68_15050 [Gammaproteobacteria bacterium]|nr:hypothetical protein [Gammaproteobacteria bacterium]MDH5802117.1 hypothetical protein [Gammaproteobacteria bacterium]
MYAFDAKTNNWIPLKTTHEYQVKRRRLRDAWIIGGCFLPLLPLWGILVAALLGAFLSFMVLDETRYSFEVR